MLIVRQEELRELITMASAIDAMEEAFAALARDRARLPDVIGLEIPEARGEVHVKGAHLVGAPSYVFKVASGFWSNVERGMAVGDGLMLLFDATTGRPEALLLDGGELTDLRTGAAGGLAARFLAPSVVDKVGLVGAGVQARQQTRALAAVRDLGETEVAVWSRTEESARRCAEDLEHGLDVAASPAATVAEAVEGADVVATVTPSREPLVRAEWLGDGCHVTAVGSDGPEKRELDGEVLARADRVFADHLGQCLRLGEIHHAVEEGRLAVDEIAGELGQLVIGEVEPRVDDDELTVWDSTGVGVQDAAIAGLALRRSKEAGRGRLVESSG